MPTRFAPRLVALFTLAGCGGIEIDLPELETGDVDVDGGLDLGDVDDGFTTVPADVDVDDGDDDDDGDADGDDGPGVGDCCEAHETPGCDDPEVAACVCDDDPFCCDVAWDGICVIEVGDLDCAACEHADSGDDDGDDDGDGDDGTEVGSDVDDGTEVDDGNDDGPGTGPCCEAHESPGCEYDDVAACVCNDDPSCCDTMWDELCVIEVEIFGCGVCGGDTDGTTTDDGGDDATDDGTTDDGGSTGPCCEAHDEPGCEYPDVEDCVCLTDPFCCEVTWDGLCADEVTSLGCGVC